MTEPSDSDVLGLVPPPRRRSVVTGAAVVALALGAAWWSADLRPAIAEAHGAASGAAVELADARVLVGLQLAGRGAGEVELIGVDDVPGARVLGAWIAPAAAGPDRAPDGLFDGSLPTPVVGEPLGDAVPVPAVVPDGDAAWLVVLWDVTDCEQALAAFDGPVAHLRTLGFVVEETLPDIAGPGHVCPP